MISADLPPEGVDAALDALLAIGLRAEDMTVGRPNPIGPVEQRRDGG